MNARGAASGDAGPPVDWPARPQVALPLNRTGCFDWDMDRGLVHLDAAALDVLDLRPDEYDMDPRALHARIPQNEMVRLDSLVAQAIKSGRSSYGAYFRMRCRDGSQRWAHVQGRVLRTEVGRPYRIIGLFRDAVEELSQPTGGLTLEAERSRQTSVVEETTAALAHARTVDDVIEVLGSSRGLARLGTVSIVLGLVEGSRLRIVADGRATRHLPPGGYLRLDEDLPLLEAARTMMPRYLVSAEEYVTRYPARRAAVADLGVAAAAFLPLIAQGRTIGALGLLYRDQHTFTTEERLLLTALTSSIAQCCSGRRCSTRSTNWRRACSSRCCRTASPPSRACRPPCGTARPATAGTSAATGTT